MNVTKIMTRVMPLVGLMAAGTAATTSCEKDHVEYDFSNMVNDSTTVIVNPKTNSNNPVNVDSIVDAYKRMADSLKNYYEGVTDSIINDAKK